MYYSNAVYAACLKRLRDEPGLLGKSFWEVYGTFQMDDGIVYTGRRTAKRCVALHMDEVRYHFKDVHGEMGEVILEDVLRDGHWEDVDHFVRMNVLVESLLFAWAKMERDIRLMG